MTRTGFYGYDIALFQFQMVYVVVIAFSCMLELHLYEVGRILVAWYVSQPVVGV